MEIEEVCPYCGEAVALWIDPSGGSMQVCIEDCWVCCRPIQVTARRTGDGLVLELRRADG